MPRSSFSVAICYAIFDGVYLFAKIHLYRTLLAEAPYGRDAPILPEDFGRLCAAAVKFAVGLCVILFSRGIVAVKNGLLSLRGPLHEK